MSNEAFDRATELAELAANALGLAVDLLEQAGGVIDDEESRHSIPSPAQHTALRYLETANELVRVWEDLTGRLRIQVLGSSATVIRRFGPGGVMTEEKIA